MKIQVTADGNVGMEQQTPKPIKVINSHDSAGTTLAQLGEGRAGLQLTNEDPAGNFASLRFRIDNNGADALIAGFQEGNQASSLRFYSEGTSSDPEMTIQSDGNVGIGTTTPSEKLEVTGTALARGLKIPFHDGGATNYTDFRIQPNDGSGNFHAYWNSTGTTSPTAILNAPAFNLKYDAIPNGDLRILAAETVPAGDAQSLIPALTNEGNGTIS